MLTDGVSLAPAPDMLFQLYSYLTGGARRQKAKALAAGEDPDGDAATLDVLAAIEKFPGIRPDPEAFIEALDPLQPRLYSISSSPKIDPGRVALTVDTVRYKIAKRERLGVASTFLGERVEAERAAESLCAEGARLRPAGRSASADHHDRPRHRRRAVPRLPARAHGDQGEGPQLAVLRPSALGHCDFFYEDEFAGMKAKGVLTRLSLAWSRDGAEKFYVQDRMREVGRDLWSWLTDGAHVYVCGDAKRMAKDVERALVDIVAQHGARSTDQAIAFVAELKKQGRYQQDVY